MNDAKPDNEPVITFAIRPYNRGFRWQANHSNGHILAESGERYQSEHEARLNLTNLLDMMRQGDYVVENTLRGKP